MTATLPYTDHDVSLDGLKLHYQEWGDPSRPAVVLLHGFGVSGHMFDEFGQIAHQRYHLIALDQRGHGDSDWASDGDYRRDTFATDLEGLRRALGIESFFLIGHAMGGVNAMTYAAHYPARVRGLVVVDARPETSAEGVDDVHRFTHADDHLEFEEFVARAHRTNPRRSIENIRERMRHRLRPADSGLWTWKFDPRFRNDRDSLQMRSRLTPDDEWNLIRSIRVPSLVIRGSNSDVLSQEAAERLAVEMPNATFEVVPEAGHSVPGDNPGDFAALVLAFLDRVQSGVPGNTASAEPSIEALVRENEAARRRRPGVGTLVALAVGAALATVGIGWSLRRVREGRRREKSRQEQRVEESANLATAQRMAALASELATVGRSGAARARALASDPQVQAALAQARSVAGQAGQRSLDAVQNVDTERLRERGRRAARQSGHLVSAGAHAAASAARRSRRRRALLARLASWR